MFHESPQINTQNSYQIDELSSVENSSVKRIDELSSVAANSQRNKTGMSELASMDEIQLLKEQIVEQIKTIYDPEIPVNIYELGLIYEVQIDEQKQVVIEMTLTSPNCPVAGSLPAQVEQTVATVEGVTSAQVKLVWNPPWNIEMMSEAAQLELGFFY